MPKYTAMEQRILKVLSDGQKHSKEELRVTIDEQASIDSLRNCICKLRIKMNPIGHEIVCVYNNRKVWYRWVRLLTTAE